MFTRRNFLTSSVVLGGGVAFSTILSNLVKAQQATVPDPLVPSPGNTTAPNLFVPISPLLTKYTEQLPVPNPTVVKSSQLITIDMITKSHKFHNDLSPIPTMGYGTDYLGPVLWLQKGITANIQFNNQLGAHPLAAYIDAKEIHGALTTDGAKPRASVHVHGGLTDPEFDGHPEDVILQGKSKTYTYKIQQDAATVWFHDHALGLTRLNVYGGLAGLFFVRDQYDTGVSNPIGLPGGEFEIPLVIQDKAFILNPDGSTTLYYGTLPGIGKPATPAINWIPEFYGDVAVVNGKAWPNLDVKQGLYRFRIVNGSEARFYRLRLVPTLSFYVIGSDGGLLNAPVKVSKLLIAPGERWDVLIDFSGFSSGQTFELLNDAVAPYPSGPRNFRKGGLPLNQIMQFTVVSATGFTGGIPTRLRNNDNKHPALPTAIPKVSQVEASIQKVRNVTLIDLGNPLLLNNLMFDDNNLEEPKQGTIEQWNIINTTPDTHPIHLHLVQFRLLGRQAFDAAKYLAEKYPSLTTVKGPYPVPDAEGYIGNNPLRTPNAVESGWKDTIRCDPGEITRIIVRFPTVAELGFDPDKTYQSADGTKTLQGYVWHCHILEHEENEMMLRYRVIA